MTKNIKYLWGIVALGFIATLIFVLIPFWTNSEVGTLTISKESEAREWLAAFEDVERTFKLGESAKSSTDVDQKCQDILGDLTSTDRSYLRCNPDFLACLARLNKGFGPEGKFSLEEKYQLERRAQGFAYRFKLTRDLITFDIDLYPHCKELYLPERLYAQGPSPREGASEELLWDNLGRNIFIDRDPVSVRDLKETLTLSARTEFEGVLNTNEKEIISSLLKTKNLASPVVSLTLSLQHKVCALWGKELLRAEVYDAATFLPFDQSDPTPVSISRSPYPWSKRRSDVFLADKEPEINGPNCARAFVYECGPKFKRMNFESLSNSWIGLRTILGHEMESMKNVLSPRKNMMFSSKYFSANSRWHQLGVRGYWDGDGRDYRNFNFGLSDPAVSSKVDFDVSFRCMRREVRL